MAIRLSTGLKAEWLGGSQSLREILSFGIIDLYTGPQPDSADDAATGTRIARITAGGASFTAGMPTGGLNLIYFPGNKELIKSPNQSWTITPVATGTIGWFRFKGNDPDDDLDSTVLPRLDGAAGSPYNELYLTDLQLTLGQTVDLPVFQLGFTL